MALGTNQAQVKFSNTKGVMITATANASYSQKLNIQTDDSYNDAYTMTGVGEGVPMKNGDNPAVIVSPADATKGDLTITLTFSNGSGKPSIAGAPTPYKGLGTGNVTQWLIGSEDGGGGSPDNNDCTVTIVEIDL